MPQHSKKTHKSTGGLADKPKPRSDVSTARQPENTYIQQIARPAIGDKAQWVRGAFNRGVSFRDIIRGSGLKTKQVLTLCGMDPDKHIELVAELESFRTNLLNHRD